MIQTAISVRVGFNIVLRILGVCVSLFFLPQVDLRIGHGIFLGVPPPADQVAKLLHSRFAPRPSLLRVGGGAGPTTGKLG